MNNPVQNLSPKSWIAKRERERVIWADDPNNSNRSNQTNSDNSASGSSKDDNSNNNPPKCQKCGVNEATIKYTVKVDGTEKETLNVCQPCYEKLTKCQECKTDEAEHEITKSNGSKIIVCEDCYKKLKEDKEQEKIIKELEAKVDKFLPEPHPFDTRNGINYTRDCRVVHDALKETDWTLEQMKKLRNILNEVNEKGKGDQGFWNKVVKGLNPKTSLEILDKRIKDKEQEQPSEIPNTQENPNEPKPENTTDEPPQQPSPLNQNEPKKKSQYVRKFAPVKDNCCDGKCKKELANIVESVEKSTLTFNKCQVEFTRGYSPHLRTVFFCEKCGQENGCAKGEFRVWIEATQNDQQKEQTNRNNPQPPREPKNFEHPLSADEICEGCGASCRINERREGNKLKYTIRRRRWIKYKTDFTQEASYWFGCNCLCEEKFKRENQQTCPQCRKREFPDMKKGWLLDYELKMAFCSPDCHVAYRNLSWEEVANSNQIEFFPPELEVEASSPSSIPEETGSGKDESRPEPFDWEKEGQKREILYWRETVKELKRQLENSQQKSPSQLKPNEIPHQQRQISYLLKLHQNTQQKVEKAFESKYGRAELNSLINPSQAQPKKNYWPLIIGGGLVGGGLIIGLVIYFATKKKGASK